jgi:alkyl hydroperoxide reductase subunit AhpC
MNIRVGQEAPDFAAHAYHAGEDREIRLSAYQGTWVVLLFYMRDFTFV